MKTIKKIAITALLLAAPILNAQVKKDVGEFTKIKSFDQITVELIPSNEQRIEITGSRKDEVEVINKNGELKIRMRTGKLLDGEEIEAKVFFKTLTHIDANEGSFIGCDKAFKQASMYASAQEGAGVKIKLDVDNIEVRAATGGKVKLSGTADNQDVSLGAGGILEAKELKTQNTKVDVKAGGEAEIRASQLADARVTAGGKIVIHGNPKEVKRKTTLGGKIQEIRE
ncbi:head GIN domain-containing protein [Flavobacterium sp.]|uniref:head GIN domain-containing protein n=1 Tax=Flavobacterium sp. TaxID=239 RepID=UPI0039E4CDEE